MLDNIHPYNQEMNLFMNEDVISNLPSIAVYNNH
jgi:hypothetical protein